MAAPNLLNLSNGFGRSTGTTLTTTLASVLSNGSNSGNLIKINSVIISNIDGVNNGDYNLSLYKNSSTDLYISWSVTVPADSALIAVTKDMGLNLEENDQLRANASVNGRLNCIVSYEVLY